MTRALVSATTGVVDGDELADGVADRRRAARATARPRPTTAAVEREQEARRPERHVRSGGATPAGRSARRSRLRSRTSITTAGSSPITQASCPGSMASAAGASYSCTQPSGKCTWMRPRARNPTCACCRSRCRSPASCGWTSGSRPDRSRASPGRCRCGRCRAARCRRCGCRRRAWALPRGREQSRRPPQSVNCSSRPGAAAAHGATGRASISARRPRTRRACGRSGDA